MSCYYRQLFGTPKATGSSRQINPKSAFARIMATEMEEEDTGGSQEEGRGGDDSEELRHYAEMRVRRGNMNWWA